MVKKRRDLLVGDTKPLLCNRLGVKSPLCGPHKGSQRQGAGGWGGTAATQLWAEPTHPASIWALLTSVAAWPLLPLGPETMEALGRLFCCKLFSEFLFSVNLKYFIRPSSSHSLSFSTILKGTARTSTLYPPLPQWRPQETKSSSKTVWNLLVFKNKQCLI